MPDTHANIPDALATQGFTAAPNTDEVLLARTGSLGRIMLNRPRAINALTADMVEAVLVALETWRDDDDVTAITIEGAGDRGLCAGGDVKGVREAFVGDNLDAAFAFFDREYAMNSALADYPKLIVSYQDGIVMGGGIGISAYAGLRIATERTRVAMPETIIGFFPDVGALYLLSRAPGGSGAYVALTGESVNGSDAVSLGLSDVVVDSASWPTILQHLEQGASRGEIETLVHSFATETPRALPSGESWMDDAFGVAPDFRSAPDVFASLTGSNSAAGEAATALQARSPLSVCATIEGLRRAAKMSTLQEVLEQDRRLARGLVLHGDFVEGVRAQLVDKDRSPRWSQASVADVSPEDIERLFAPLS